MAGVCSVDTAAWVHFADAGGIKIVLNPYDGIRVYIVTVLSYKQGCTFTTLIDLFISLLC